MSSRAALIISCFATVISAGSLIVSILSFRSAGPRIFGRAYLISSDNQHFKLMIELYNAGRTELMVDVLGLRLDWWWSSRRSYRDKLPLDLKGPGLPLSLKSYSGEIWEALGDTGDDIAKKISPGEPTAGAWVLVKVGGRRLIQIPVRPGTDYERYTGIHKPQEERLI
jgi:hypothetical protein